MRTTLFLDKFRFIPVLHLATLVYYLFGMLHQPGLPLRLLKLLGYSYVFHLILDDITKLIALIFPYEIVQVLCFLAFLYGICLFPILYIRRDVYGW